MELNKENLNTDKIVDLLIYIINEPLFNRLLKTIEDQRKIIDLYEMKLNSINHILEFEEIQLTTCEDCKNE